LQTLSDEANGLSLDYDLLKISLTRAQSELERLSSELAQSRTEASELSSSLRLSEESLLTCERSLALSLSSRSLELWLWRGGAAAGIILAALALIAR
jgi:chromosome segregation ATPase